MPTFNNHTINISTSELVPESLIKQFYTPDIITGILHNTLEYINGLLSKPKTNQNSFTLPYFSELDTDVWLTKSKELDIYLTDINEGRELNLEAREKDYATNILSYPSELPPFILEEMHAIPLGELIICHEVVETQAKEQNKTVADHVSHLIVHGILHLLGFDHELSQDKQDEMEGFEVTILDKMEIANPYE